MDVPFRSVASHLVRLSREARQVFELDVLRPPTYAQLTQVLQAAKDGGFSVPCGALRWPWRLAR